ncbi:MAG: YtxH domain-containing protein [Tannerella sp.]|jgi:gas vesicle protein|nr:YtxH domain-containing protein [Tannerella sp.]
MKSNGDSNLLLGLVIGAAVGAAIGYLVATDKKEQILDELKEVAGKVKDGFNNVVTKYKEAHHAASPAVSQEAEN